MPIEPFESLRNLNECVGMFEAATHPTVTTVTPPTPSVVYVARDGSNQDETAARAAVILAGTARVVEGTLGAGVAEILTAARDAKADAIVVPVPYGRDYSTLKGESLGSVVDMLLLESTVPVLCVRDVLDEAALAAAFARPVLPVTVGAGIDGGAKAAGWAIRTVPPTGEIDLVAVADDDVIEEARRYLDETPGDRDALGDRVRRGIGRAIGGLSSTIQKWAFDRGAEARVQTVVGQFVPSVFEVVGDQPRLIVWSAKRDHNCPSFHRATDLILASRGPVLIV